MKAKVNLDVVKRGMKAEMADWGDGSSPATVRVAVSWHYRGRIKDGAIAREARGLGYEVVRSGGDEEAGEACGREMVRRIRMFG